MDLDDMKAFGENLFSFARMLGGAPGGGTLALPCGGVSAASGQPYAGENYLLPPTGPRAEQIKDTDLMEDITAAIDFFGARASDFIVPILPRTRRQMTDALMARSIVRQRTYAVMLLDTDGFGGTHAKTRRNAPAAPACALKEITPDNALRWGLSVWYTFGGAPCKEADDYAKFGRYLAGHGKNRAFALEGGGQYLSTGLIHETDSTVGLYYFATLPGFRRRGLAAHLMDGMTRTLRPLEKPLVLLATEEGRPFYGAYGFETLAEVPIYSRTSDI